MCNIHVHIKYLGIRQCKIPVTTKAWFKFSYRTHRFKHSFQDSLKTFLSCGKSEVETSSHYLFHCSNYWEERLALLNTVKNINISILQQSDSKFTCVLLFGNTSLDNDKNTFSLDVTTDYIISTRRFNEP